MHSLDRSFFIYLQDFFVYLQGLFVYVDDYLVSLVGFFGLFGRSPWSIW